MNKKAILPKTILTIVISILCLVALIFLSSKLYGIFLYQSQVEQAKATLEQISLKIESLEEGESTEYIVTSPKEWGLIYYEQEIGECKGDDCLCVCPAFDSEEAQSKVFVQWETYFDDFYKICETKGTCKEVKDFKIKNLLFIEYEKSGVNEDWGYIGEYNWIYFINLPKEIYFKKQNEEIILSSFSSKQYLDELLEYPAKFGALKTDSFKEFLRNSVNGCVFNKQYLGYNEPTGMEIIEENKLGAEKIIKQFIKDKEEENEKLKGRISVYVFDFSNDRGVQDNLIEVKSSKSDDLYKVEHMEVKNICQPKKDSNGKLEGNPVYIKLVVEK